MKDIMQVFVYEKNTSGKVKCPATCGKTRQLGRKWDWWRRGESNSGPYYTLPEALQAYPLIAFRESGGSSANAAPSSRFHLSFGHTGYVPKRIPLR